ncbi:MAG: hypothetical protein ACX93O_03825 [Flagellimonas sp.]
MQLVHTMLCDAFLSLRDKKEEQEDSVLTQRHRSCLLRKACVYRGVDVFEEMLCSVFGEKTRSAQ